MNPYPSVAGAAENDAEGHETRPRPRGPRGLLVGRRAPGLGAGGSFPSLEDVGARDSAADGLWAAPGDSPALRPAENHDAARVRGCASSLCPAYDYAVPSTPSA